MSNPAPRRVERPSSSRVLKKTENIKIHTYQLMALTTALTASTSTLVTTIKAKPMTAMTPLVTP